MAARKTGDRSSSKLPEHGLPKAELDTLSCLVQRGTATAREIRESIHSFRPMSHGSMVTLLNRLEARGLVGKDKGPVGKAFVYHPTGRTEPLYRRMIRDFVHRVFGGSGVAMMTSLFETKPPTRDELDQLQSMLDDMRKGKKAGK